MIDETAKESCSASPQDEELKFPTSQIMDFMMKRTGDRDDTLAAAVYFGASQDRFDELLDPAKNNGLMGTQRYLMKDYGRFASKEVQERILFDFVQKGWADWAEQFAEKLNRELSRAEALVIIKVFCEYKGKGWMPSDMNEAHVLTFPDKYFSGKELTNLKKEIKSAGKGGFLRNAFRPYEWGKFITK